MPAFTNSARKDLDGLPEAIRRRALTLAGRLDQEPALGKKLLGKLAGRYSARLGRAHRVIYKVEDGRVIVLRILPRRDAYR